MKRSKASREHELHAAQDAYQHGPHAKIRFVKNSFKQLPSTFSFSDRFVFIYFLAFIVLLVLGVIAVFR